MVKEKINRKRIDKHNLVNVMEPNLLRDTFPYSETPRLYFDNVIVPMNMPEKIWITDTTFRDGQQARPPFSVKQIVDVYDMLSRLDGGSGIIRQSEFFLYSDKDRQAVRECQELGHLFPEITGWIRAVKSDFQLVKQMELKETGILTSASDYHIFLKLKSNRAEILDRYLGIVKEALSVGVKPRCHFEDITRADIYGFVLPFAQELMKLRDESNIDIKIRLCDTMGYGDPNPTSTLPRSVPKLMHTIITEGGVPSELLEWHGHNDFHKVHANSVAAWLYGCSAINGSLFGTGERTGNSPIESLVFEYMAIKGQHPKLDTTVITDMAYYFSKKINFPIPSNYPFVGRNFNITRAGIHADGVIKNEEIYNIFDTNKYLKRPIGVLITDKSGVAGIAWWLNAQLNVSAKDKIDKHHPGVKKIYEWTMDQYEYGRTTGISDEEMTWLARKFLPEYFESDFDRLKEKVYKVSEEIIKELQANKEIRSHNEKRIEEILFNTINTNPFIQLIMLTDTEGRRIVHNITLVRDKDKYLSFTKADFTSCDWFKAPLNDGKMHVTDLYVSRFTGRLCITVSAPIWDKNDDVIRIIAFDVKFEDAIKL